MVAKEAIVNSHHAQGSWDDSRSRISSLRGRAHDVHLSLCQFVISPHEIITISRDSVLIVTPAVPKASPILLDVHVTP